MKLDWKKLYKKNIPVSQQDNPLSPEFYTPEQLGWENMGQITRINIGPIALDCLPFGPAGGAHTHVDPDVPNFHNVCISDENFIFRKYSSKPSELMWHEYFHALVAYRDLKNPNFLATAHADPWKEVAIREGRPWIAASGIYTEYDWFHMPPNDGEPYWGEDWKEKCL